jgi:hypothetical protein
MKNAVMRSGLLLVLVLVLFLGGCAVGQKIRYNDAGLELNASGNIQVAVATQDCRAYVKDGEKDRMYVGNFRGGFGNPWDLSTESGKPLADDMSTVICASLEKKGFACTPVSVEPNESQIQITSKLKAANAKSMILLTINEWLSSTYQNTGLTYDLVLTIMDNQGSKLAGKSVKGEDELGGSFWNPPAHAKDAVPQAYKKKLELLLNDAEVISALK